MGFIKVATKQEIAPNKSKTINLNGRTVGIYQINGQFYAVDDFCPHKGAPLHEGQLLGTLIMCPWHRWTFDLASGHCVTHPGTHIPCFEVKIEGDDILLKE
jgi:nitrite reductase (NADH) small subunit